MLNNKPLYLLKLIWIFAPNFDTLKHLIRNNPTDYFDVSIHWSYTTLHKTRFSFHFWYFKVQKRIKHHEGTTLSSHGTQLCVSWSTPTSNWKLISWVDQICSFGRCRVADALNNLDVSLSFSICLDKGWSCAFDSKDGKTDNT